MMISLPTRFEAYGAVKIFELARVLELDSLGVTTKLSGTYTVSYEVLEEYAASTAIVVPVKDEDIMALEGVLRAIPHASPIILVSASRSFPVDAYSREVELARTIHSVTGREILVIHQRDPAWAEVLAGTPLEAMLEDGMVRRGKGEGMVLGVIAAAGIGARYVGFIDSDNYVPGAANEYSKIYYLGFSLSGSPYTMVRIVWHYKGKLASSDMYLRKRGRVSVHTNNVLNYALSRLRKVETDIIRTANSGEHAMSIELALRLRWAGGFAVEPYELVQLLEDCFLGVDEGRCGFLPDGVNIFQIEARNPHIHAERGNEHIAGMLAESLGTVYHSRLAADETVKERIHRLLHDYKYEGEPPRPRVYSLEGVDPSKLFSALLAESTMTHYFK